MTDYERSLISDLRLRLFSVYCSAEDYKNNGMTVEDWFKDEVHLNPFRDHDSFGYMTWTLCKLLDLDWHKEKAEAFERYKKDHADEYDEDEDGAEATELAPTAAPSLVMPDMSTYKPPVFPPMPTMPTMEDVLRQMAEHKKMEDAKKK